MKEIRKYDNINIPDNLDDYIVMGIKDGAKIKNEVKVDVKDIKNKNQYKVAMLITAICATTITSAYAVTKLINYFDYNKDSIYKAEENKLEKYTQKVGLCKKHDGVELTLDTVTSDDSYITITYTAKSEKKISDLDKSYTDHRTANPFVRLLRNEKEIFSGGAMESESKFINDYELKGIMRYRVANYNVKDGQILTIDTWNVFGIEKDWSIDFKINKKLSKKLSHKYNINKTKVITRNIEYAGKILEVKNKLTVKNVAIGPLGNMITITEEVDTPDSKFIPAISNGFALLDDKNNYLDLVDLGGLSPDTQNKPLTSTYEFISANKDIKSITLIPISRKDDVQNKQLKPQVPTNLPMIFDLNKDSKVIINSFKVTKDKIKYSFKKYGYVPHVLRLVFLDNNGDMIILQGGGITEDSIDRDEQIYNVTVNLDGEDKELAKKIKTVTWWSDNGNEFLYKDKINFNLKK